MRPFGCFNMLNPKNITFSLSCMRITMVGVCFFCVLFGLIRLINEIHAIDDLVEDSHSPQSITGVHIVEVDESTEAETYNQFDEHLVQKVRSSLVPPSSESYQLNNPFPANAHILEREVRQINALQRGFFLEVGAGDGETRSPTLCLEWEDGWTGLLAEADPALHPVLRSKNRKAHLALHCVSGTQFSYRGSVVDSRVVPAKTYTKGNESYYDWPPEVDCYPLLTHLLALNVFKVDYMVINTNGGELDILRTLPLQDIFVKTVAVRLHKDADKYTLSTHMGNCGYNVRNIYTHLNESFIMFVKNPKITVTGQWLDCFVDASDTTD